MVLVRYVGTAPVTFGKFVNGQLVWQVVVADNVPVDVTQEQADLMMKDPNFVAVT